MKQYVTFALASCFSVLVLAHAQGGDIRYVGSSTVGKFVSDASEVYTAASLKLDTKPESSGGETCSIIGACDVGGVARELKPGMSDQGVVSTLIGKDAIAVIVHPSNPVRAMSKKQLTGIFTGKINNWKDVGGNDAPITPLVVKKGSATRSVFQKVVLDGNEYDGVEVVTPDAKIVSTVAMDPNAIGQISFAFIIDNDNVVAVDVDGQKASVDNAAYPITRPLYLATKGAPQGETKAFVDWALSDEGQGVVKRRFVGIR